MTTTTGTTATTGTTVTTGPIDCDIHPAVAGLSALLPYLPPHWREQVVQRGMQDLETIAYPAHAPLTSRPDWRPAGSKAAVSLDRLRAEALDPFGTRIAICNCLYGIQALFSEDMAAAFVRAVNQWMATEWLDREPRLRASIVLPMQSVERAVDEIEHWAPDRRFVQAMVLASGDAPLGKRQYWPIYAAAVRHDLPIGIHAGSAYHNPNTAAGWGSTVTEDYVGQAQAFQSQLTSLICEGVFSKFPTLKVVLLESGFTWLAPHMWRLTKYWRGLRPEIPWVDRATAEIVRDNIRLTLQPVDAPAAQGQLQRMIDHMGSDRLLLFSTDYPHWQFDGSAAMPDGLSPELTRRILVDNALETYSRLKETGP